MRPSRVEGANRHRTCRRSRPPRPGSPHSRSARPPRVLPRRVRSADRMRGQERATRPRRQARSFGGVEPPPDERGGQSAAQRSMFTSRACSTALDCWPFCTVSPIVPLPFTVEAAGSSCVSEPSLVLAPVMSMLSTSALAPAGSPGQRHVLLARTALPVGRLDPVVGAGSLAQGVGQVGGGRDPVQLRLDGRRPPAADAHRLGRERHGDCPDLRRHLLDGAGQRGSRPAGGSTSLRTDSPRAVTANVPVVPSSCVTVCCAAVRALSAGPPTRK